VKVKGKVFVVTGGANGIGKELVINLLKMGAKVAAVDIREKSLQELLELVGTEEKKGLSIHPVDITDKDAVMVLSKDVIDRHGTVDGIVNNAGIIQPFVKINDLEFKDIENVVNINFYGTLYMIKAFLPQLLKREEAHIVNISSMGGFLPVPGQSVYGASKAAVKLMTEGLFAELLETNVRVTVVFPGATKTKISNNSGVSISSANTKDASGKIPMISPEKAAQIIISGIEKNKPQIFTGTDSKFMNFLYRLSPVFATKFIAKQMRSLLK